MAINRYKQLLASIPKGLFYSSDGQVIPYRGYSQYQLYINTGVANCEYEVIVNDAKRGYVTTNSQSNAILNITLVKGTNRIKLVESTTGRIVSSTLTTRDSATFMAAHAEVLETLDTDINQLLSNARLASASADMIEDVFGRIVSTSNTMQYDHETYRELLQEIRIAYRYWGGTIEGIRRIVSAFTHINPLLYNRSFGPTWILGKDMLYPKVDTIGYSYYTTPAESEVDPAGNDTIVLNSISKRTRPGDATLTYSGTSNPKTITFKSANAPSAGAAVQLTGNGEYVVQSKYNENVIMGCVVSTDLDFVTDANNELALEIDNRGVLIIDFGTDSYTIDELVSEVNSAFTNDIRYGPSYAIAGKTANDRFKLYMASSNTKSTITIHPIYHGGDAAQTIFDLSPVRGKLQSQHVGGSTTLTIYSGTDMTLWPSPTTNSPVSMLVGRTVYTPYMEDASPVTLVDSEIVSVTNVNKITRVLTLSTPLVRTHDAGVTVELYDQVGYTSESICDEYATITINNFSSLPNSDDSDTFTVSGRSLPDGWMLTDLSGNAVTPLQFPTVTFFDVARNINLQFDENRRLTFPVPDEILKYKGFNMKFSVWGSYDWNHESSPYINTMGISFDGGTTFSSVSPTISGAMVPATNQPCEYSITAKIPASATKIMLRFSTTSDTVPGKFIVHKIRVTIPTAHAGLCLGNGTTPRNETKIKTGQFLYVWSPTQLTNSELELLGLKSNDQSIVGHIDKIMPANVWLDKFDVSEYDGSVPVNIVGSFTDGDFTAGTSYNLDTVLRVPSRYSYLKPATVSEHTQTVTFDAQDRFTLECASDQNTSTAVLFEDDIPVDPASWHFITPSVVEMLVTPNTSAAYTFKFNALISFQSAYIDLGASYQDYMWMVDYHIYNRPDVATIKTSVVDGLTFDGIGVAELSEVADTSMSATLTEYTGIGSNVVPRSQWSFIDTKHIKLNPSVFISDHVYELQYTADTWWPVMAGGYKVELRSASSTGGLSSAVYHEVSINQVIDSTYRYHQMKVTFSGIKNVYDVRLQSILIKGLNLFGTGGSVPVLR